MMQGCDMKPLHPIEQVALTLSLAVVCAMVTTRCTHAHASENQSSSKPDKTLLSIENNGYAAGGAFAYPAITVAKSTVGLGRLNSTAQLPRICAVLFCVHGKSVMTSRVGTRSRVLFSVEQSTNPIRLVTNCLVASGDEFLTQSTGGYQNA
jgi:hypothetical protein